jgi:hypothetical protein
VDPAVAPAFVLGGQPQDQPADLGRGRGAPGALGRSTSWSPPRGAGQGGRRVDGWWPERLATARFPRHVIRTTAQAKPWEHYRAEHLRDPDKLPLAEARRRFEAQPRVLSRTGADPPGQLPYPHRDDLMPAQPADTPIKMQDTF